jgi:hypothetical protein
MAFSYTVDFSTNAGSLRFVSGTYTNTDTDSGGAIATGLSVVRGFHTVPTSHVGLSAPKYSASTGTVTLVTPNGEDGIWSALGT